MSETRKLAAILVSDVAGYSRLAGADEERTLARLRALRSDLIDPTIALYHGRIVKRTGDRTIVEFRSVVDAVRLAIEVQGAMVDRNAGVSPDKRIEFRVGIHLGDVVEEGDGDLMGDGLASRAAPGRLRTGGVCLSGGVRYMLEGSVRRVGEHITVKPSHAARSRPWLKLSARPTAATRAEAPIPGIVVNRRASSFSFTHRTNSASKGSGKVFSIKDSSEKLSAD
jgi:adenylate cyclase